MSQDTNLFQKLCQVITQGTEAEKDIVRRCFEGDEIDVFGLTWALKNMEES